MFKNSQPKWGWEGGVRLVLHRTVFVKATLFFHCIFYSSVVIERTAFFYNNRIKLRSLSDLQLFPQPGRCLL